MTAIKTDLHNLIDSTDDLQLLEDVFMILTYRKSNQAGNIWKNLTEEQQKEVLKSESEIGKSESWKSHEEVKRRNEKWLR